MTSVYGRLPIIILLMAVTQPIADSSVVKDADRDLFRYIHEDMQNRFFDITTPIVQRMGDSRVYTGVFMLLCAFGDEKMAETGKLAAAAFMEAGFIAYAFKWVVNRPRPLDEDQTETDSFPSGHATLAFTMATVAGHKYPRLRIPLYTAALMTAFSRVYLGRHYPSDVLAGAAIGTLVGIHVVHCERAILGFTF